MFIFALSSATLRIAGSLQQSTEVMRAMQALIKVPEIQATMQEMSKEMMKVSRGFFVYGVSFVVSQVG